MEFCHVGIPCVASIHGTIHIVKASEALLKKMKSGKTTGPDDLAADLSQSKLWYSGEWLAHFFNYVVEVKKVPQ